MLNLLDEKQIVPAVQKLTATSKEMRIAVAFWGVGAAKKLGLKGGKKLKVICNLESGATNPKEIRELKHLGVNVKTNPRLHAKVYCGDDTVILGSSNASTNGLVMEETELQGWLEANALSDDAVFVKSVKEWFDKLWNAPGTNLVSNSALKKAEIEWEKRQQQKVRRGFRGSLLDAVQDNPKLFGDVFLAIYNTKLSPEARKTHRFLQSQSSRGKKSKNVDEINFKSTYAYEDFELPKNGQFVDFNLTNREKPSFRYVGKPLPSIKLSDSILQVAPIQPGIMLPQFEKPLKLSRNDKNLIIAIQDDLMPPESDGERISIAEVVEKIDKR